MLAANIGAGSTVGAAGLGYTNGIAAWWWVGSAAIGSVVLALWIGPAMRRDAAAHGLRTVGDYLEHRYSAGVRALAAGILWVGSLFILAGQLWAIGSIIGTVAGAAPWVGCALGGAAITVYFTAGGLLTAAWVNVVQLAVKLVGFAVALPLAIAAAGGLDGLTLVRPDPGYWQFWQPALAGPLDARRHRAAVHRVAGPAAEDLRRPRRPRRPRRRRPERARPVRVRHRAGPARHRRPLAVSVDRRARRRAADDSGPHAAAPCRRDRPRRRLLGRGQRGRRGAVHADDVAVAGLLQAIREPGGDRRGHPAGRAVDGGRERRVRHDARHRARQRRQRADDLLHAHRRVPVHPDHRRALRPPDLGQRRAGDDDGGGRHGARGAPRDRRARVGRPEPGHRRPGCGGSGVGGNLSGFSTPSRASRRA